MRSLMLAVVLSMALAGVRAETRYVVIDQDGAGPGGSDQQSMLLLLQAPDVKVLGITMVSGDVFVNEGVRHTLRMLELAGRTDVPVVVGSRMPLVRTAEETVLQEALYGRMTYKGAFGVHGGDGPLVEGESHNAAVAGQDAAHFLIEAVHRYPHQVTVFGGGPMTNIALAIKLDPQFVEMARELVFMGGSLNPRTDDPEFSTDPRHEFNFWFDPEAAHIVLTAPWKKMTATTVDVSIQAVLPAESLRVLKSSTCLAAAYMSRYGTHDPYMWDELAEVSWIAPEVIRAQKRVYLDVDLSRGHSYGDMVTWSEATKPNVPLQLVNVQTEVDVRRFAAKYLELMTRVVPPGKRGDL
jgi:purine nucleosidase